MDIECYPADEVDPVILFLIHLKPEILFVSMTEREKISYASMKN